MRVIIAGTRDINDYAAVARAVTESNFPATEIVSGTAWGVDSLGEVWSQLHRLPVKRFEPDWDAHGKRAGIVRNHAMGDYADAMVAVWDGQSAGTSDMIGYMRRLGKPVHVHMWQRTPAFRARLSKSRRKQSAMSDAAQDELKL